MSKPLWWRKMKRETASNQTFIGDISHQTTALSPPLLDHLAAITHRTLLWGR